MTIETLHPLYGPITSVVLFFLLQMVWPALVNHLFPALASRRQQEQEAQRQVEREEREAQRQMVQRLFAVVEANTAAFIELRTTLGMVAQQSNATAQALADLHRDVVAGLPPHPEQVRPPRGRKKEPATP